MTKKLFFQAVSKFLLGAVLIGLLLFLPAGTIHYWNAWLFLAILLIPMSFVGVVLMFKNPELLNKRLNAKERHGEQSLVVKLSGLMFVLGFISAGFNFRYSWIILPDWVSFAAAALFIAAYVLYAEVLRENTYLSRTIEVQQDQVVISTGLYGIIRHPMYSATLILFLSIPLVLGSLVSFFVFLAYPMIIAKRIRHEESILEKQLDGYIAYKSRVKYKLIPFIW